MILGKRSERRNIVHQQVLMTLVWVLTLVLFAIGFSGCAAPGTGIEPGGTRTPEQALEKFGPPCEETDRDGWRSLDWGMLRAPTREEPLRYVIIPGQCATWEEYFLVFGPERLESWGISRRFPFPVPTPPDADGGT